MAQTDARSAEPWPSQPRLDDTLAPYPPPRRRVVRCGRVRRGGPRVDVAVGQNMELLLYMGWICSVVAFLAWPATLLAIRYVRPRWMPWFAILIGVGLIGWVLWGLQISARNEYLDRVVRSLANPDPNDPLVDEWQADGARNVFALYFGWAISTIYFLPWLGIYLLACFRRIMSEVRRGESAPVALDEGRPSA